MFSHELKNQMAGPLYTYQCGTAEILDAQYIKKLIQVLGLDPNTNIKDWIDRGIQARSKKSPM